MGGRIESRRTKGTPGSGNRRCEEPLLTYNGCDCLLEGNIIARKEQRHECLPFISALSIEISPLSSNNQKHQKLTKHHQQNGRRIQADAKSGK